MQPNCPLCGTGAESRFEKQGVPYFRCPGCRFVFGTPDSNPNLENRIEDFESSYLDYLSETVEDRWNMPSLYDWVSSFASLEGVSLLDVGAGGGKFVRYLRGRSVEAVGLEPSKAIYERFLSADDCFVNATLEEFAARTPPGTYDVVTALDVIEHVPRPDEFLRDLSRLLRPGGLLCVSTPDVESLPARLQGRRWHYFYDYHLSYLSRRTLTELAARYEFEPLHFSHRGRYHSVGYAIAYFLQFALRRQEARVPRRLHDWVLPMNLFDVLYAGFRKPGGELQRGSTGASSGSTT